MPKELKSSIDQRVDPRHSLPGFLLGFLSAVLAEFLFGNGFREHDILLSLARCIVVFLAISCVHRYAIENLSRYKPKVKDFITLTIVTLLSFTILWVGEVLSFGVAAYFTQEHGYKNFLPESLLFAVPFAAGALLLQAILGAHYGLIYAVVFSFTVAVYYPMQPILPAYIFVTCLAACMSLSHFRSRSAYLKVGLRVALISFPFALSSVVMGGEMAVGETLIRLCAALMGGILCAFLAAGLTPIAEYLGGYVTDMRLIEMATLDHPLLKDLSVQAPGTWNHSMVMGMMAEAAAIEIGANPVLARVGAYFHDIGKTTKPLYFVENQVHGENRHDKLSTSMSALIIRSHVKDGIELAEKHKVPEAVVDMIPQHHGTSTIEYFYDKACKEAEEAGGGTEDVDASLYQYPGPKPQTKEAGILMLADGIEAATRTLSEPNLDRITGLVQKMMNKVFASGELNECDLTLRDLHVIAKNFARVLSSIHHQRVAYAEPAEKISEKAAPGKKIALAKKEAEKETPKEAHSKEGAELDDSHKQGEPDDKAEKTASSGEQDKKRPEENLKRLGLS